MSIKSIHPIACSAALRVMLNVRAIYMKILRTILTLSCAIALVSCSEVDPLGAPEMKQHAPAAVESGWKYFGQGDYETALRRFQMAVRHDKEHAPGYYGIAYVYSVQGKLDDAIQYYRSTLKYDQSYEYTYANLGYALLQKGEEKEAIHIALARRIISYLIQIKLIKKLV